MAVKLTESAVQKVQDFMKSVGMEKGYVRIGIKKSCSGQNYSLGLEDSVEEDDELVAVQEGINVVYSKSFSGQLSDIIVDFSHLDGVFIFNNNSDSCSSNERKCCGGKCHS
jgi:iron-sulfur cluster assembly accessory protein